MQTWVYDLEIWENFFSGLFLSEDGKDEFYFMKYKNTNYISPMLQFISQDKLLLVSYNGIHYDSVILKGLLQKPEMTNRQIYNLSKSIIKSDRKNRSRKLKELMYADVSWQQADMMKLLQSNMNIPSLKHCSVVLKHPRVQDLPKPFDEPVKDSELDMIHDYNRNDVDITRSIWMLPGIQEDIALRRVLEAEYHTDLLSSGDSKIVNVVLEAKYGTPSSKGTPRKVIDGYDLIPPGLVFETKELQAVVKQVRETTLVETITKNETKVHRVYPRRNKFALNFSFGETKYKMGVGGLHSDNPPEIYKEDDEYVLLDADVASYYPFLRQVYNLFPEHLDQERIKNIDRTLIDQRIAAKKAGDKTTADSLKITVNGLFGKMNYEGFWLYDPLAFYRTTLYGQLLLLRLIEMLYLKGIHVFYANTDGIIAKVHRSKEKTYYAVCKKWEEETSMSLDYDYLKFMAILNVNSYITVNKQGKVKTKKDFPYFGTYHKDFTAPNKFSFIKGYSAPVIAVALQNYFVDGILPEDTINNHGDIHDFLFSPRASKKFYFVYRTPDGEEIKLQKTNRFYITFSGGVVVKKNRTDFDAFTREELLEYEIGGFLEEETTRVTRETAIQKGQYVHILNDIVDDRPPINRQVYIEKVWNIIHSIEPIEVEKEMTIFDFI